MIRRWTDAIRRAGWLTPARARTYGLMLALFCAVLLAGSAWKIASPAWHDPAGRPLGVDFNAFWAGAVLALHGHPAAAYDRAAVTAAEVAGGQFVPGSWFIYLYPPIFQLFSLPLGLLPYGTAMLAFLLATYAALYAGLRRILPSAWPWLAILAFPAASMNAMIGQNGAASAACFAGGMIFLERRPALAGAALGLLSAKPHLAICVPAGLLAARRWTALAACAATAGAAGLLSLAVFGLADWATFLANGPAMHMTVANEGIWPKLASIYAAVKLLHGSEALAWTLQGCTSLAVLLCVGLICRRRPGAGAEIASIAAGGVLCTPYVWNYDLVVLAVPLAWAAGQASERGWRPWEKASLAAVYVLSAFGRLLNQEAGLPLAPALLVLLLVTIAARAAAVPAAQPA
jgi:hypothetical protein